jgi:Resolvase, N terminal domain
MTTYGYARVSTNGQDLGSQEAELMAAGAAKVFKEKVSGAKTDRAELAKAVRRLEPGDVLIVTRLDRLARSTRDLLNVLATVGEHEAGFRSLRDAWADTTTPHGRLMLTILGGLAEFERAYPSPYRRRQSACQGSWRALRSSRCPHATPAGRSPTAPWQWRGASGCSAVFQCLAGDDIAACGSLIHD